MTKKNSLYILITGIIIVGLYIIMMPDNNSTQNRVDIVNAQISPAVVSLYQNNCASCHGKNLQGQVGWQNQLDEDGHRLAPPLNGTAHTWHHSPEYLYRVIKYGFTSFDPNYEGKMLGNSGLSDEEVWELVSYMKEVWPNEIKEVYENRFGT